MTSPAVIRAGEPDLDVLSQVITDAFFDLAPSRWLIACPGARRRVFPGYFRLSVEHALASGIVHTNAGRNATALWLPGGPDAPALRDGYAERLAAETSPWTSHFLAFDRTLDQHHPSGIRHHYLAILAVHPGQQGRGIGTALLDDHHATMEDEGLPAYLEASSPRAFACYPVLPPMLMAAKKFVHAWRVTVNTRVWLGRAWISRLPGGDGAVRACRSWFGMSWRSVAMNRKPSLRAAVKR